MRTLSFTNMRKAALAACLMLSAAAAAAVGLGRVPAAGAGRAPLRVTPALARQWNAAVSGFFTERLVDYGSMARLLPQLSRADLSDPASAELLRPSVLQVQTAARVFVGVAGRGEVARGSLAEGRLAAKLAVLSHPAFAPLLADEAQRVAVREAAATAQARLARAEREAIAARMAEIAAAIGSSAEDSLAGDGVAASPDGAARAEARLRKAEARVDRAPAPAVPAVPLEPAPAAEAPAPLRGLARLGAQAKAYARLYLDGMRPPHMIGGLLGFAASLPVSFSWGYAPGVAVTVAATALMIAGMRLPPGSERLGPLGRVAARVRAFYAAQEGSPMRGSHVAAGLALFAASFPLSAQVHMAAGAAAGTAALLVAISGVRLPGDPPRPSRMDRAWDALKALLDLRSDAHPRASLARSLLGAALLFLAPIPLALELAAHAGFGVGVGPGRLLALGAAMSAAGVGLILLEGQRDGRLASARLARRSAPPDA